MRTVILNGREIEYQNETYQVVLPGRDGEFSVMDFHQPFLYRLRRGVIRVQEQEDAEEEKIIHLRDGLAKFRGNELLILKE